MPELPNGLPPGLNPINDRLRLAILQKALLAFVDTVEATGGIMLTDERLYAPVADQDWIDLGEAYLKACEALDRRPKKWRP